MPVTEIKNRNCVDITGEDAHSFLQGMITNDLDLLDHQAAIYACLLSPQGKFLHDFLVTRIENGYRLETQSDQAEILIKRFKLYKLRAKVQFEINGAQKIYAGWGDDKMPEGAYEDPRLKSLGWRLISDHPAKTTAGFDDYDLRRIESTIPDGSRDLIQELSTLYEGNIDTLHGVAFDKGCYMGQELTARIHYRGLVKKRLFTVTTDNGALKSGQELFRDGRLSGKVTSAAGNRGLSILKISEVKNPFETEDGRIVTVLNAE